MQLGREWKTATNNPQGPGRAATLKGVARMPNRSEPNRPVRLEQIVCPNCGKSYQIDVASLGRAGRSVRC